jgi:hypothetical protein
MEMEIKWFKSQIEDKSEEIDDYVERIKFLYNEKSKFLSMNRGEDANQVFLMFDNLIEKEKLLNELSKKTNQESGLFIDYANNSNIKKNTAESERLHNQLNEIAYKIQDIKNLFLELDPKKENEYENLKIKFYECILDLYHQSETDNYFWQFCPFSVYKYHFNGRFLECRKEFPDISREDFLMNEIGDIQANILQKGDALVSSPDASRAEELKLKEKHINYLLQYGQILIERDFFNLTVFQKFEQTQKRKTEFLREKIEELTNLKNSNQIYPNKTEDVEQNTINNSSNDNPHARIFLNGKSWQLFDHWRNDVKARTQLAEFSYIYRQMSKDGLIYENVKPTEFRDWLNKNYNTELDELKQLSNCDGGNKYSRYQTAKILFQC